MAFFIFSANPAAQANAGASSGLTTCMLSLCVSSWIRPTLARRVGSSVRGPLALLVSCAHLAYLSSRIVRFMCYFDSRNFSWLGVNNLVTTLWRKRRLILA
jgi:hypothetical protein